MLSKGFFKFTVGVFAAAAGVALVGYTVSDRKVRELEAQVSQLEQDRARLREYARRLTASRRVAQITVLDKFADAYGDPINRILWQEIAEDGRLGPPQEIEAIGELVYFEAAVVKFEPERVGQGEQGRDFSIALFRRVFGELQSAATVPFLETMSLDRSLEQAGQQTLNAAPKSSRVDGEQSGPSPSRVSITAGADNGIDELFWALMDNPGLASQYGVRVAQCEAPAAILRKGQVWEISLDAIGGINLRIIGQDPTGLHTTRPGLPSG